MALRESVGPAVSEPLGDALVTDSVPSVVDCELRRGVDGRYGDAAAE